MRPGQNMFGSQRGNSNSVDADSNICVSGRGNVGLQKLTCLRSSHVARAIPQDCVFLAFFTQGNSAMRDFISILHQTIFDLQVFRFSLIPLNRILVKMPYEMLARKS